MNDRWQPLVDRFLSEQGELVQLGPDDFSVSVQCGMADPGELIAAAPCALDERWSHEDYLVDRTGGELHAELTRGLWANDAECVLYAFQDHWQAGLFADLRRFGARTDYEHALAAALREGNDLEEGRF